MEATTKVQKLDLASIMEDMFMVLTDKEREVIARRYSLNNKSRETLEQIGKSFSVTRERVRQIESGAIKKLRRTIENTKLRNVTKLAKEVLAATDGIMLERHLIKGVLDYTNGSDIDAHIVRLALAIDEDILSIKKSKDLKRSWRLDHVSEKSAREVIEKTIKVLSRKSDVVNPEVLATEVQGKLSKPASLKFITACFDLSSLLKSTERGFGLMVWRHINPRSIQDKALIVLRQHGKPLHFVEVANRIAKAGFDNKSVTTQAVHNELIRDDNFVLVGRGLYALREWGYKDGTVSEVIEEVLKKAARPMTKTEIVREVLKRRDVKVGTIALNLQKNPNFVRLGRAVYEYRKVA